MDNFKSSIQRIGVLGASFNPPTLGHQDVIEQVFSHFDEILLVPSVKHAFQKTLAPLYHRLAMLNIFVQHWQSEKVKICNIEESLLKNNETKPVYTYDVLTALTDLYQKQQNPFEIRFIVGPDIAHHDVWQKFYRYDEIEKAWPLFVVKERISVHSTQVRNIIQQHKYDDKTLRAELLPLLGEAITNYILVNDLYQDKEYAYG